MDINSYKNNVLISLLRGIYLCIIMGKELFIKLYSNLLKCTQYSEHTKSFVWVLIIDVRTTTATVGFRSHTDVP